MPTVAAIIFANDNSRFLGIGLTVRAVQAARRAGITRVHIVGEPVVPVRILSQLQGQELDLTWGTHVERPFDAPLMADIVLVWPATTIVQPPALASVLREAATRASVCLLVVDSQPETERRSVRIVGGMVSSIATDGNAASTDVAALTLGALEHIRDSRTPQEGLERLARSGRLCATRVTSSYCEVLRHQEDIPRLEGEYLRHSNGGDAEAFSTRQIRRFSIPLSRLLLRLPITANHVTLAGFGFSIAAGLAFSQGGYRPGIAGALLYYISMVFDCSDGEVARARFGDSRFGAWLETVTDYLSYFVILGGLVWGHVRVEGFCRHATAALIASVASLAIVSIVAYLRARTAAANPGAFDDALAAELQGGTPLQRFAGWARQLIKRSFLAHLILFQALIGQLPALIVIWALGSVGALVVVLTVQTHLVRRVRVTPIQPALALSAPEN
jgi:phosphatidylglycerophosphate synthase